MITIFSVTYVPAQVPMIPVVYFGSLPGGGGFLKLSIDLIGKLRKCGLPAAAW
jgi:hypothetical protein